MSKTRFVSAEGHPRRCKARTTTTGDRCRKFAIRGKDVCRKHGGATPIKHGLRSKYVEGTSGGARVNG